MSWVEFLLKEKYEAEGFDVIHYGAPDLILLKDGKITFVEAKSVNDRLQDNQIHAIDLLHKHGFEARVEKVRGPDDIHQYIFQDEEEKIMEKCADQNITLKEIRTLITRSAKFPSLAHITYQLNKFYDEEETKQHAAKLCARQRARDEKEIPEIEQRHIMARIAGNRISLGELWNLISRSSAQPSQKQFTEHLIAAFNAKNAMLDKEDPL